MTVVILFLSLGWHGPCWTDWLSRTKRIKGEGVSGLSKLSSLHSWRWFCSSFGQWWLSWERGWAAVMCVQAQECWTQHLTGALQWVWVSGEFQKCFPCVPAAHGECVMEQFDLETVPGQCWVWATSPIRKQQCHRPEQFSTMAQPHSELSFVSGADGEPWRAWTERW